MMRREVTSEAAARPLFTLYDSVKLPGFNKAFRKIAGIPPREYRSYRNF